MGCSEWGGSKSSGTTTAALGEDIKTAAHEAFVPSELEQHLATNRARLIAEFSSHSRQVVKNTSDSMDVDRVGKGGKKIGKEGKDDGKDGKNGGPW